MDINRKFELRTALRYPYQSELYDIITEYHLHDQHFPIFLLDDEGRERALDAFSTYFYENPIYVNIKQYAALICCVRATLPEEQITDLDERIRPHLVRFDKMDMHQFLALPNLTYIDRFRFHKMYNSSAEYQIKEVTDAIYDYTCSIMEPKYYFFPDEVVAFREPRYVKKLALEYLKGHVDLGPQDPAALLGNSERNSPFGVLYRILKENSRPLILSMEQMLFLFRKHHRELLRLLPLHTAGGDLSQVPAFEEQEPDRAALQELQDLHRRMIKPGCVLETVRVNRDTLFFTSMNSSYTINQVLGLFSAELMDIRSINLFSGEADCEIAMTVYQFLFLIDFVLRRGPASFDIMLKLVNKKIERITYDIPQLIASGFLDTMNYNIAQLEQFA